MGIRDRLDWLWPRSQPTGGAWTQPVETKSQILPGSAGYLQMLMGRVGTKSGQQVGVQAALECMAYLCGARVIAEGLAQVPCKLVQVSETGPRRVATEHALHRLLHRRPNDWQTSFEFREQIGLHLVLCGNAFVFINRVDGQIRELLPYQPGAVTVTRNQNMTITYRLLLANGGSMEVPQQDIWHIRGPSWNGWLGLSGVYLARNAIGLSLAAEEFGSELFANGARPSGLLSTKDGRELSEEQIEAVRESWEAAHVGSGQRMRTAVLDGLEWSAISSSAEEAQFIELRKQQVLEVARALRINPIMLMHSEGNNSYASVEQMFLAHATHTLGPWFERFVQSAEVALLSPAEWDAGYRVELVDTGLVRGTAKERAETMAILRQNGVITANEWRDEEDYSRVADPEADQLIPAANLYGPRTAQEAN